MHFLRSGKHGSDKSNPLFIHEDGRLLTSADMNRTLKRLMVYYPVLAQSKRDTWSGHSFRSGFSSMLEKLSFKEDDIKNWGRWQSSAYKCYLKDLTARRDVHYRVINTFDLILRDLI